MNVLITGASAGIGEALAHEFAREGYNCIITGRDKTKLAAVAETIQSQYEVAVETYAFDLTDMSSLDAFIDDVKNKHDTIDCLVNNAGAGLCGAFVDTDPATESQFCFLNVNVLTHLCKAFLPDMVKRGNGTILNVGSIAGFQPGPFMAVYYATKAYVYSFSQALADEVKDQGVLVSVLCPGLTTTEFQVRAHMNDLNMVKNNRHAMTAQEVARLAMAGLKKRRRVIITGNMNKVLSWLARALPNRCLFPVIRYLQKAD